MRSERGSAILEYLLILGAAAMIYFGGPLLIHGVQDWLALANAERVAMHQVAVNGYYSGCALQRLDEALQASNIPPNLVTAQGTTTQQQYGQPVSLAVQYTYSPASWLHIPLSAGSQTISQYLPGQVAGGGCPPAGNGTVGTGAGVPSTVTIYATPNPANVNQSVAFSGEVMDQYGNPVATNVTLSGGGQSAQVFAQGGYYSGALAFSQPGSYTITATAGAAAGSVTLTVEQVLQIAYVWNDAQASYSAGKYGVAGQGGTLASCGAGQNVCYDGFWRSIDLGKTMTWQTVAVSAEGWQSYSQEPVQISSDGVNWTTVGSIEMTTYLGNCFGQNACHGGGEAVLGPLQFRFLRYGTTSPPSGFVVDCLNVTLANTSTDTSPNYGCPGPDSPQTTWWQAN